MPFLLLPLSIHTLEPKPNVSAALHRQVGRNSIRLYTRSVRRRKPADPGTFSLGLVLGKGYIDAFLAIAVCAD